MNLGNCYEFIKVEVLFVLCFPSIKKMGNKNSKNCAQRIDLRPKIDVIIGEQVVSFLYDTGAQDSTIDVNLFNSFQLIRKKSHLRIKCVDWCCGNVRKTKDF